MKSAREKLGQSVQRDIFFDFKKRILFSLIFAGVFLLLAIYNVFFSSPIINILLVVIGALGAVTLYLFSIRIKKIQKEYEQAGQALLKNFDQK